MTLGKLILQTLFEIGEGALDSFFPTKYPEAKLWRELLGLDSRHEFSRPTFSVILSRLQSAGLVERRGRKRQSVWRLTEAGDRYLKAENNKPKPDGIQRLVIFDIPEKERRKRDVIRGELAGLGYSQLQKSVWKGEIPLSNDFIELLDALSLHSKVHIFSVQERGTL
ncbi:MAG: Transcriptional regulator, PaaX family [Parcubacteria group bacterium GW2011_GWB1_52_7]|nr:MAG: Transcriptional regulator, PaaX family [Parcubacteria group bacterium GW2011_GWB1_52_7]